MEISNDCVATNSINKFLLFANSSTKFVLSNLETFIKVFDSIFKFAFLFYLNDTFKIIS